MGLLLDSSHTMGAVIVWLTGAGLLTLRFYLTGAAWTWLLPAIDGEAPRGPGTRLTHAAVALLGGVTSSVLLSLVLAECGQGFLRWEVLGSVLIVASGVVLGARHDRQRSRAARVAGLPGACVVFLGLAVILQMPHTGEWIVGGWDPGVYMDEGICVGRTGTFHPAPMAHHEQLTAAEVPLFCRGRGVFTQSFPAVPLDPGTRQIRHYFFRFTPALISALYRCGGMDAALRVNWIMGFLGLVVFAAFLRIHRATPAFIVAAVVLCGTHPLWLYHLHLPTSEMTELFLMLGAGLTLGLTGRGTLGGALLSTLLLCAIVNRVSFVPFAGLLVLATAWADMSRMERGPVMRERLLQLLAIGAGTLYDFTATRVTMATLQYVVPELLGVSGATLTLALLLDVLAWRGIRPRWLLSPGVVLGTLLAGGVLLGLGVGLGWRHVTLLARIRQNALQIGPYLGTVTLLLAVPGAWILWRCRTRMTRHFTAVVLVLSGITLLLLVNSFVVPICPWATRRYVPFTLPLLVLAAGIALSALWDAAVGFTVLRRMLAVGLLGLALAGSARLSWHAVRGTEYDGLSAQLAEVAAQIGPRDLVIADHFKWGMPLLLLHGKHVLDGSKFYGENGAVVMADGLIALERMKGLGWRVRFLTSTGDGLEVYPRGIPGVHQVWTSSPLDVREIIHSARARDFVLREKHLVFRLYAMP